MTAKTRETVDLDICTDCLFVLANGPESDGERRAAESMAEQWDGWELTLGSLECDHCPTEDGDCEPWFSWSECDGCGSNLGGDRSHATAWKDPDDD